MKYVDVFELLCVNTATNNVVSYSILSVYCVLLCHLCVMAHVCLTRMLKIAVTLCWRSCFSCQ